MESCSASKWSVSQVSDWLSLLDLDQYKQTFSELSIDGSLLLQITDSDLINDFGVKIRLHRFKILEGLKRLKEEQSESSEYSLPDCDWGTLLLKAIEGQSKNKVFEINYSGGSIGRNSGSNEFIINESFVSRKHCEIRYNSDSNQFFLKDLGSTTGTFIMVKEKTLLTANLIFQMGLSEFKVVSIKYSPFGSPISIVLIGYEGPTKDFEYFVDRNGGFIGRDSSNIIAVVEDSQLSAKHGRIFYENSGFYVEDLGSTNKTWKRISGEGEVSENFAIYIDDFIKIGSTILQVSMNDEVENKENLVESNECRVCDVNEPNTLCYPCGHVFCGECLKKCNKCPDCKKQISDKVKVYK